MAQLFSTDISSDIVNRITSAADQLYEANGKTSFPNVDVVRRRARVNMNDASAVMRMWRHAHQAAPTQMPVAIPEDIHRACQTLLSAVWKAAIDSASTSLHMAQAGWEQERAEAEACRQQLACAFDSQAEELALLQRHAEQLESKVTKRDAALQEKIVQLEECAKKLIAADGRALMAEARSSETAKRVDDLKAELSLAHTHGEQDRQEARARMMAMEATIITLRDELRETLAQASALREQLASMRGAADAVNGDTSSSMLSPAIKLDDAATREPARKSRAPKGA